MKSTEAVKRLRGLFDNVSHDRALGIYLCLISEQAAALVLNQYKVEDICARQAKNQIDAIILLLERDGTV